MTTDVELRVRRAIAQSRASASGGYGGPSQDSDSLSLPSGLEQLIADRTSGHISEYEFNQKFWQLAGKKLRS